MKFTLLSIFIILSTLAAEIPSMINYQGILTNENGTVVDDNTYNLSFSIYDVASGGSELWSETHSGVEVTQGLFNIMLGSVSSLSDIPFDMQYYLEIAVGGDVMTDRIAFSSTAYSLNARAVNGNQGIPAGGIIMWSGSIETIPDGWALCDGNNNTPNLTDRFIVAAGYSYAPLSVGGSDTHDHTVDVWAGDWSGEVLSHTRQNLETPFMDELCYHGQSANYDGCYDQTFPFAEANGWSFLFNWGTYDPFSNYDWSQEAGYIINEDMIGSIFHGKRETATTVNHVPQYMALAFIMKL